MYKEFWGWSLENIGKGTVDTKYIVEYVNDKRTWQKVLETEDCLELYSKKEFNNVSEALRFYMVWYVNEECFDIRLWEQIYVNDEMVLEQMIEPENTTKYSMRLSVNREMENRMSDAEKKASNLEKSNDLYKAFIEKIHAKELFEKYVKEMCSNDGY